MKTDLNKSLLALSVLVGVSAQCAFAQNVEINKLRREVPTRPRPESGGREMCIRINFRAGSKYHAGP